MSNIDVIYNGACPICSREIGVYRRAANADEVTFTDLTASPLPEGLSAEDAARRLHVVRDGQLLSGTDAFIALWQAVPGWRWLGRIVAVPGIRQLAGLIYDHALAPALFALHRRRQRRAGKGLPG